MLHYPPKYVISKKSHISTFSIVAHNLSIVITVKLQKDAKKLHFFRFCDITIKKSLLLFHYHKPKKYV